jgi:hypothetical protein
MTPGSPPTETRAASAPVPGGSMRETWPTRLGIPGPLAEIYADRIDWHQVARLVQHGCPPRLALRIVR